ncbi:MAG: IPTL-CTERM sorting domain-containing protein [Bacteroidota bacterium]
MRKNLLLALLVGCFAFPAYAQSIMSLPNLTSITFYERTGGASPTPYTFAVNSPEMTTRLTGTLGAGNRDFFGTPTEHYDVFYSDANGNLDLNGTYITVECQFTPTAGGGGLNIAGIELNFSGGAMDLACQVGSFVGLGNNYNVGSEANAVDGDLQTNTTMGNNAGSNQRLRITVGGYPCSAPVPTLSQWGLILLGLTVLCSAAIVLFRRRRQFAT